MNFKEIFLDAMLDTLKTLPFLLCAYLAIEWIEHRSSDKLISKLRAAEKYGGVVGSLVGCIPQCGFSVLAAKFYNAGIITLGSLLAVFLSTSDEALPVLLADPSRLSDVLLLVGCKVAIAAAAGTLCDWALRARTSNTSLLRAGHSAAPVTATHIDDSQHRERCADAHNHPSPHDDTAAHHHNEDCHCNCHGYVLKPALLHTTQTLGFIFAVLLVLGTATSLLGESRLEALLLTGSLWQPIIAPILGLIPNCAPSVVLAQLYISGRLSFGGALAGLCASSGVGLAVFFKSRGIKSGLKFAALLYAISAAVGLIADLII
ncbi:MAG: putative manganese transporter [Oscillospiraceae bacterium]